MKYFNQSLSRFLTLMLLISAITPVTFAENSSANPSGKIKNKSTKKAKNGSFDITNRDLLFYVDGECVNYDDVAVDSRFNGNYSARPDMSWCHITEKTNTGFKVVCDNNPEANTRTAKIVVADTKGRESHVMVTQFGTKFKFDVNKGKAIELEGNGDESFIAVSTNEEIIIEGLPRWCKLSKKARNGFYLVCDPNDTGDSRSSDFVVKTEHHKVRVALFQNAKAGEVEIYDIKTFDTGIGKDKTMNISFRLNVHNMKDKICRAVVNFYDSDGNPLSKNNTSYNSHDGGTLNVYRSFTPTTINSTQLIELSIPCSQVDPLGKGKEILYSISVFDKSKGGDTEIGNTRDKRVMDVPALPYLECVTDVSFNGDGDEKFCAVYGNIDDYTVETNSKWIHVKKTAGGFLLKCDKNRDSYRNGVVKICNYTYGCCTEVSVSQSSKGQGLPWYKGRFSIGIDLAADANYNMKGIGSKENSELFYSWGGGVMLRIGRVCWSDYRLTDVVNVAFGARYMKYSYNYLSLKGDLGDYVVFPVNLKLNTFKLGDKCRFYLGGGYEYGMALKDAPTFMDWNAGIGLNSRHVDWYIFFKQYFDTQDAGKFYFDNHYKNHIGTSLTFYF